MRVLLVPQKSNYPDPRPCMDIIGQGFPYIAASLKAGGHEVFVANVNYRWCPGTAAAALEETLRERIAEYEPDLIGVGGLSADYPFVKDAIRLARKISPDTPIVCGGGIMTYDSEFIFQDLRPDFGVVGEAEESIVLLADAVAAGSSVADIPNVIHWRGGEATHNEVAYSRTNLDEYAFPDYDLFDIGTYLQWANQGDNWFYAHTRHNPRVVPISLGRSCPYRCTFCCHMEGPKYRSRSVDNAIEEIVHLYERYQFNLLFIYDELFTLKKDKVSEFCARVGELGYDFDWVCGARVTDVDAKLLAELKQARCIFLGYGLESASSTVLKSMKKGIEPEDIERAIQLSTAVGIGVQGNFIFGDPAETPQTIAETGRFYDKWCRNLMVRFNHVTPYPGSEIFRYCLEKGIIRNRRAYYDGITGIGTRTINMTTMPDKKLKSLLDDVFHDELTNHARVDVDSYQRREIPPCDTGALVPTRRAFYELDLRCPHCDGEITYHYPLLTNRACVEVPAICAICHRRLLMQVHTNGKAQPQGAADDEESPLAYAYDTPTLVASHKGFNLVAFRNRVYALSHALGTVDLSSADEKEILAYEAAGQCVRTETIREARRKVDELRPLRVRLLAKYRGAKSRARRVAKKLRDRIRK